ncbi:MAG: PaaI family thioesterase [Betaproteobacteria bacterium]|nr:PaaI family thioesterase [Betaproteobacteria bacterium]
MNSTNEPGARWAAIGPRDELKSLGGLAFLQNVVNGVYPTPPIAELLGFRFAEAAAGRAVIAMTPHLGHHNLIGTVHGGVHATLLDTAMACAILAMLPPGQGFTTLEFKVSFIRAMTADTGEVRAEGALINLGRTVATAEGRLTDSAGKLLAHATTTCLILPLQ